MSNKQVRAWVDGSCNNGAWRHNKLQWMGVGIVLECGPFQREWGVALRYDGTNNIAELMAIKLALLSLKDRASCDVTVVSDSEWAIGAITKPWLLKRNKVLVDSIKSLAQECGRFQMVLVKGHSTCASNNRADELAVAARRQAIAEADAAGAADAADAAGAEAVDETLPTAVR